MGEGANSRREFIKGAGAIGAGTILGGSGAVAASPKKGKGSGGRAKNLIFLVVDGMGHGTFGLAHHWQLRHGSGPLRWTEFRERPDVSAGLQDTASASSPVTDSAAAGSAWGCGERVNNGSVNVSPEGRSLTPLFRHAKEAGKAVGLVTTCRVTHATPAAFVANTPDRDAEDVIARQYLERGVDVILGGGARHFGSGEPELADEFAARGYRVSRGAEALRASAGEPKLLGLYADSHVPYAIDRANDPRLADVPGLRDMFAAALESLGGRERGFVLQVESGRVDHAGHGNDPAAILREQLEFDACVALAEDFVAKHPDTLLVVTTDHGTGGCQLNGIGENYGGSGPALERLNRFDASFEAIAAHYKENGRFDPKHFERKTGFRPSESQIAAVRKAIAEEVKYLNNTLTAAFADELMATTAVGWTSTNHTAENVELLATGPGADVVPRFLQNREVNGIVRRALGI